MVRGVAEVDLLQNWTFNNTIGSPAAIEWINNQYIMVGSGGMIKSSTDGVTWTDHMSLQITANLDHVAGNASI